MTSPQPVSWIVRRVVRFAQTEADQTLLQAVEVALESQFHGNFSALCKQALRSFLLPESAPNPGAATTTLQQQIVELQIQVARLEGQMAAQQANSITFLVEKFEGMGDRLQHLESLQHPKNQGQSPSTHADPPPEPDPVPEVDPLLSRLAPFLEDF
ncbi:MAG: hypothetical protein MUF49_22885 [Oculatellaceae cyanobacterium Prado106]|jgi:TolA-binding protein|nr:hypothetical protein [Oculatellaceae cyanobacterium Prado106]